MRSAQINEHGPDYRLVAYHYILFPSANNDNFYREIRSYNAFFHNPNLMERRRKWKKYFITKFGEPIECLLPRDYNVPEFRYTSIYEFFGAIGYDYRKRKFSK